MTVFNNLKKYNQINHIIQVFVDLYALLKIVEQELINIFLSILGCTMET